MDDIEKILVELCQESSHPAFRGCDFSELSDRAWKRIVSRALVKAIDEGKIRHHNNRYYAA